MNFIKRYWRTIFPAFFIIAIWCFSSANGDSSSATSGAWAAFLHIDEAIVRKLAHFFLFAGLGYSTSSAIRGFYPCQYPRIAYLVLASVLTAAYGAFDEAHQAMVVGRNAQISDVLLDSLAGICGVLLYISIFCLSRELITRKKSTK